MTRVLFYRDANSEAVTARVTGDITADNVNILIELSGEEVLNVSRYKKVINKNGTVKKTIYPFFRDFLDQALGFNSIKQ
jgi:hypothetical protein